MQVCREAFSDGFLPGHGLDFHVVIFLDIQLRFPYNQSTKKRVLITFKIGTHPICLVARGSHPLMS